MTSILGISAFYHDAAAALIVDGEVAAAAQEERFSRVKHDSSFPTRAIEYCLEEAGITPADLDYVGFYDKPYLKFERLLETYLATAPRGFASFARAMPLWLKQKLYLPREISRGLGGGFRRRYVFPEHHQSHAASAFYPSPFEEAAILTVDGVGEWTTASWGVGRGHTIELTHRLAFPHSLGLLYSAFTYFTGFAVNSGEYKLMGLAPYGEPRFVDRILEHLLDLKDDGSFRLDLSYFAYPHGLVMTNRRFAELFGGPPRRPEAPITEREMDLAASIQKVTEEVLLRQARHLHAVTGLPNLCLAGGVALNCVANGRILREGPFERLWIQPAADDAGGALGAALLIWHHLLGHPRTPVTPDAQRASLLGPAYSDAAIRRFLATTGAPFRRLASDEELCGEVAELLAAGKVVGWFDGRMELGPRALGARSILADARSAEAQRLINRKVKFREGFRPFAPAVLAEHAHEYFELEPGQESPYMLLVAPVRAERRRQLSAEERDASGLDKLHVVRSEIPAVTHVDDSARVQTVAADHPGRYRRLIEAFNQRTGCPVVVNTSFNLGWEPIVRTPEEAYRTFMASDLDALALGSQLLVKAEQPAVRAATSGAFFADLWASPCCGASLTSPPRPPAVVVCAACGRDFPSADGIPQLYWPHAGSTAPGDVTEQVKAFYEETPFPDYDEHDSLRSLIDKSRRGGYAAQLDRSIPYNTTVLEVGCGTGQLANFLGIGTRRVVGADLCLNSLRLGEEFRRRHGLGRVRFVQMNLFKPCFAPARFDVLLANGVLHHTADPAGGLAALVPLVKPGGYVVVGLYNRFGRLATDLRRGLFRLTGGRCRWLDPYLRTGELSAAKRRAWFADQYRHPHESKHTVGEVLGWLERCGLELVRGVPATALGAEPAGAGELFTPAVRGSAADHLLTQLAQVASGSREGGFFVLIGRRRPAAEAAGSSTAGPPDRSV